MENIEIITENQEIENKENKNKSFKFKYMTRKDKEEIFILGPIFVKNNKDKCNLIIDDSIDCELREKYRFNKKGEHSVTLVINDENINFSHLFCFEYIPEYFSCLFNNNLIDASSLENLNTSECIDLSFMFYECHLIKDFNFVKNWNVSKCKYFSGIFFCCNFKNLDFLSNWNLKNAIDLSNMFDNILRIGM
jgi:hypothetical protein